MQEITQLLQKVQNEDGYNVNNNFKKKKENSPSIINNFHFKHWNMHHCTYKLHVIEIKNNIIIILTDAENDMKNWN